MSFLGGVMEWLIVQPFYKFLWAQCSFYCYQRLTAHWSLSWLSHRAVTREVVSSTPPGPILRVLK